MGGETGKKNWLLQLPAGPLKMASLDNRARGFAGINRMTLLLSIRVAARNRWNPVSSVDPDSTAKDLAVRNRRLVLFESLATATVIGIVI